ncbi:unnamed protein product [Blepharisma stoltei]|uniref:Uncharacterized protein n=1 Tax=Blepharisma stoltei TaxID=1481888 RepID=A0AAU9JI14_9CILI|nr:unnamed protein product [Blepharisma stoltei]
MESWINKILPSCCARGRANKISEPELIRSQTATNNLTPVGKVRKEESIDILSPKIFENNSENNPENEEKKDINYITLDEISPIGPPINAEPLSHFGKVQIENKKDQREVIDSGSRNSTRSSFNSMDKVYVLLDQFRCANCAKKATGWCTGCPSKRFCSECFTLEHRNEDLNHKFCKYKTDKPKAMPSSVLHALALLSVKKPKS